MALHIHCNSHTRCWENVGTEEAEFTVWSQKRTGLSSSAIDLTAKSPPPPPSSSSPALPLWLHFFLCHGERCNIYLRFIAHSSLIYRASCFMPRNRAHRLMFSVKWAGFEKKKKKKKGKKNPKRISRRRRDTLEKPSNKKQTKKT